MAAKQRALNVLQLASENLENLNCNGPHCYVVLRQIIRSLLFQCSNFNSHQSDSTKTITIIRTKTSKQQVAISNAYNAATASLLLRDAAADTSLDVVDQSCAESEKFDGLSASQPASEVEAIVRSLTNMAAAKIAAVDFNKMTSKLRHSTGLLAFGHVCWGRSASQSTASAVLIGRKKSREYLI